VLGSPWYILLSIAAIAASALVWDRFFKHRPERRDGRIVVVYLVALVSAFVGAKLVFLAAEGWHRGCVAAGCCPGVECAPAWWAMTDAHGHARVPSAVIELGFNLAFLGWALAATRFGWQPTQRFNLYLIAYGAFRFVHEYWRDDHRWLDGFGGYHAAALALVVLGVWMYRRRTRLNAAALKHHAAATVTA